MELRRYIEGPLYYLKQHKTQLNVEADERVTENVPNQIKGLFDYSNPYKTKGPLLGITIHCAKRNSHICFEFNLNEDFKIVFADVNERKNSVKQNMSFQKL